MDRYVFDQRGVRRVIDATRRIEGSTVGGGLDFGANDRRALIRRAILTTALTAGTTSQAGSGMATLQQKNSTGAFTTMVGPNGSPLPAVKVWNPFTSAGVAGRVVIVIPTGGEWWVIGYDCP